MTIPSFTKCKVNSEKFYGIGPLDYDIDLITKRKVLLVLSLNKSIVKWIYLNCWKDWKQNQINSEYKRQVQTFCITLYKMLKYKMNQENDRLPKEVTITKQWSTIVHNSVLNMIKLFLSSTLFHISKSFCYYEIAHLFS